MEKLKKIVFKIISDKIIAEKIVVQLQKISNDPTGYLENSERMLNQSDDYMWLAMVDLLIENNYAFEIDWKDTYEEAKEGILEISNAHNFNLSWNDNHIDEDSDAEEFFPMINQELQKENNLILYNIDIDSDSYVTVISAKDSSISEIDERIKTY